MESDIRTQERCCWKPVHGAECQAAAYEVGRVTASVSGPHAGTGISVLETGDVHYPLVMQVFFHDSFVICFYIQSQRRSDVAFSFFSHWLKPAPQEVGTRFLLLPFWWWLTSVFKIRWCPGFSKALGSISKAGSMEEWNFLCCKKSIVLNQRCFILFIYLCMYVCMFGESLGTLLGVMLKNKCIIHACNCGSWTISFHTAKLHANKALYQTQ